MENTEKFHSRHQAGEPCTDASYLGLEAQSRFRENVQRIGRSLSSGHVQQPELLRCLSLGRYL
jgi:hypothetical protein